MGFEPMLSVWQTEVLATTPIPRMFLDELEEGYEFLHIGRSLS